MINLLIMTRIRWAALIALPLLFLLTGCGATSKQSHVFATGPVDEPLFVDVSLFRGNVRIVESPGLGRVEVDHTKHAREDLLRVDRNIDLDHELERSVELIGFQANLGRRADGSAALVVSAFTAYQYPEVQWMDVDIRVPKVDGVSVETRDGNVVILDAAGPITANTSNGFLLYSSIHPIDGPVNLMNTNGEIDCRIQTDSSARFDVESIDGQAEIDSGPAEASIRRMGPGRVTGSMHGGEFPITLRATTGNARVVVRDAPARLSPLRKWTLPIKP